jgi:hypothetical protein
VKAVDLVLDDQAKERDLKVRVIGVQPSVERFASGGVCRADTQD